MVKFRNYEVWCKTEKRGRSADPFRSFKNDISASLQLPSISFPLPYSSATIVADKAGGGSGVPWTKAIFFGLIAQS